GAKGLRRLVMGGCGSSAYAGLVGKFMIETLAGLPVEVDYASEYRYRGPIVDEYTAVLAISQSGETADTLAAMQQAQRQGPGWLGALVNVPGSQAARLAGCCLCMEAGPETSVASTKAFTASLAALYRVAVGLGWLRGVLADGTPYLAALAAIPAQLQAILDHRAQVQAVADRLAAYEYCLYLGRGPNYPIALEGA